MASYGCVLWLLVLSPAALLAAGPVRSAPATESADDIDVARLNARAVELYESGRYEEALAPAMKVLAICEQALGPDHPDTATSLNNVATLYQEMGAYAMAEPLYQRALAIREKALGHEHPDTDTSLNNLAGLYAAMGAYAKAEPLYQRVLGIEEKTLGPDHPDTATSLGNLAALYDSMGTYAKAEPLYQRALAIREKALGPDHPDTATGLNNLAVLYQSTGAFAKAEPLYRRVLVIEEGVSGPDHPSTARSLNNLAALYQSTGAFGQAEPLYHRALAIYEKALGPDHPDTAKSLNNLADLYRALGAYAEAEPLYQRALAIREKALGPDHPHTATSLSNLAVLYWDMGAYAKAEPLSQRALAICESVLGPEHPDTATNLNNLAVLYRDMGVYAKAEPLYRRALAIYERALGPDHPLTATSLNNLAALYRAMKAYAQAEPFAQRALAIALGHGRMPVEQAMLEGNLAGLQAHQGRRDQAIFFGKQAVNGLQRLRGRLSELDKGLQQGFVKRHEGYYKALAGWLIEAGRLAEAQQVTAMLKEQELFELIRRDAEADPRAATATFTGFEAPFERQYEAIAARLSAAARGLEELQKKAKSEPLSAEEQARQAGLERQLGEGRDAFERYLTHLEAAFAKLSDERRKDIERLNLAEAQALQATLDTLGHGAVLLHYVVLDNELKIILTTPRLQRGYTVKVEQKALNQAIAALREGIERRGEIDAPARQLHDWLIAPLQADLKAAGAQTLMVALTDTLRYLPFAALHDGQQWLAQRYALAMYTEAARDRMRSSPLAQWQLQAFGLTRRIEGYKALPGVKAELTAIVGAQGLPGKASFDEQFTAASFKGAVDSRPPVLHVASHFVFRPGTELDSFLLLGDGNKLSLADIKGYSFRQLDLLTLSACETAVGGGHNENGREIEGFGALAQKRGANAVLATLWPVADASTAQFMQRFYKSRQDTAGMTKAEALRQAQLALIEGRGRPIAGAAPDGERQAERPGVKPAEPTAPADPARPYAHQYYWAPFVLMGNWL